MKKLLILLLLATQTCFAADGTVGWFTNVRGLVCPGHTATNYYPEILLSFETLTNTWHWDTNFSGIVYTPRKLERTNAYDWVEIDRGYSPGPTNVDRWGFIQSITYPESCCVHPGFDCFQFSNATIFGGGTYGTNQVIITDVFISIPTNTYDLQGFKFITHYEVDNFTNRTVKVEVIDGPESFNSCYKEPHVLLSLVLTNYVPKTLVISGAPVNTTGLLYTNTVLESSSWVFAGTVSIDGAGTASKNVEGWLSSSTNSGFIMLQTTNNP